jgi:cytochrome oxidase assembly protein ShyY1
MSEELEQSNDGTWSGLKKTIIGVATTAVMGLGTWGITKVTGGGDEPAPVQQAAPAPVINITTNNTQQQSAGGTKVIERVVEKPAAKPAEPAPKKKEFTEEPKW